MKKYIKYLKYILAGSLTAFIVVVACDESNLDLRPNSPTEADYYVNEDQITRLVFGVYAKQTDLYYFNNNTPIHPVWLLPGDDLTTNGTYAYETFAGLQPADYLLNEYVNGAYGIISRCNIVLEKVVNNEDVYETPALADAHRGEALFLRALYHFNLANLFGPVPMALERYRSIEDENYKPNSTVMEIFDQCIADLEEAATLLPDSWEEKYVGRVTADGAYGLLGKVYCYRACHGSNASADYASAITAFGNISNETRLTDHYGSNFDTWDENNEESLFEFQASQRPGNMECIWLWNDFTTIGPMSAFWGFFSNSPFFYDHTPFMPTTKLMNSYEAGDPRIDEVFTATSVSAFQPHGFEFIKYTKREKQGQFTTSLNNPRILRLGDCILLEAEARLQTGDAATATSLVNDIRERARQSVPETDPESTVPADLATVDMQDIMDERLRELCGEEFHRWGDLKRWDAAGYIDLSGWGAGDNHFSSLRSDFNFTYPTNLVFPIPLEELDYNEKVVQNPGY